MHNADIKFTLNNFMDPFNIVKNTLALNLAKEGHSLADLEDALRNINTGEGVLKISKMASGMMSDPISSAASGAFNLATNTVLPLTMATGGLMGLGVDAADGAVQHQNKKLREMRHNIEILKKLKQNVSIEHAQN